MSWLKPVTTTAVTGDFDSETAGTVLAAGAVAMNGVEPGSLSCETTIDCETNTLTMAMVWQISDDGSTWVTLAGASNNAADVVLATGTAGADAAVTKAVSAPPGVYGARFCRAGIQIGVTSGTTSDTYSLKYRYAKPRYH